MSKDTKLIFYFSLILFLSLSFVSAEQQSLGYTKTNQCITLKQSYANSSFQNVTGVTLPDKSTIDVINKRMTDLGGGLFNYSFCDTGQIGQYIVDGVGDVDGTPQTWTYDFYATPLGISNGFIFYLEFIVVILLIFSVGLKIENPYVMMLGSILVLILGFFVIINGVDMIKNTSFTWPIGLTVMMLGVYFMFLSVQEQLKEWG